MYVQLQNEIDGGFHAQLELGEPHAEVVVAVPAEDHHLLHQDRPSLDQGLVGVELAHQGVGVLVCEVEGHELAGEDLAHDEEGEEVVVVFLQERHGGLIIDVRSEEADLDGVFIRGLVDVGAEESGPGIAPMRRQNDGDWLVWDVDQLIFLDVGTDPCHHVLHALKEALSGQMVALEARRHVEHDLVHELIGAEAGRRIYDVEAGVHDLVIGSADERHLPPDVLDIGIGPGYEFLDGDVVLKQQAEYPVVGRPQPELARRFGQEFVLEEAPVVLELRQGLGQVLLKLSPLRLRCLCYELRERVLVEVQDGLELPDGGLGVDLRRGLEVFLRLFQQLGQLLEPRGRVLGPLLGCARCAGEDAAYAVADDVVVEQRVIAPGDHRFVADKLHVQRLDDDLVVDMDLWA